MITDKDVAEGIRTAWAANTVLDALVPDSRVYADRVAEDTAWPNAKIVVKEGEITRMGSSNYLRDFEATVTVETLASNADSDAIRAALSDAFGGTADDPTAGLTVPDATVMHCLEDAGGTVPKSASIFRKAGSDYLRVVSTFNILARETD